QPPLHGCCALHAVVHLRVFGLHELPPGQSPATEQPHAPATQVCPLALLVQSAQLPLVPHALGAVPPAHIPAEQQPPLHGETPLQAAPQVLATESHALPIGQSAALLQPHLPLPRHTGPATLPLQSMHCVPLAP